MEEAGAEQLAAPPAMGPASYGRLIANIECKAAARFLAHSPPNVVVVGGGFFGGPFGDWPGCLPKEGRKATSPGADSTRTQWEARVCDPPGASEPSRRGAGCQDSRAARIQTGFPEYRDIHPCPRAIECTDDDPKAPPRCPGRLYTVTRLSAIRRAISHCRQQNRWS